MRSTDTGEEIRLISPNGSGDRLLWHPQDWVDFDTSGVRITSLAWKPDARELAFSSNLEAYCSWYGYDLYALRSDGAGLRRVTNPPACAGLEELAKGSVTVQVENHTFSSGLFQIYIQGASSLQQVSLAPGAVGTVTFPEVADFGDVLQPAVAILGGYRWPIAAAANVRSGETVHAGTLYISGHGFEAFGAHGASWRSDGSALGYVFGDCTAIHAVPVHTSPGDDPDPILGVESHGVSPCDFAWGPTSATADQYLYTRQGVFEDDGGIYLATQGEGPGVRLVEKMELGYGEFIEEIAWLPDASGFLFSGFLFTEVEDYFVRGKIYRYDFASGVLSPLTDFEIESVMSLAVSPDGEFVAFELEPERASQITPDLWLMRLDGSEVERLVENARLPTWSRGE